MALTTLDVYKLLPKTNCKDCDLPTCMAFAMQVAAKQRALVDCPHVSEETKSDIADASTPPMRLVKIGGSRGQFMLGQETVMFRHEERFFHATGVAVKLASSMDDKQVDAAVDRMNGQQFERVGEMLKISLCALELDGVADPLQRATAVSTRCHLPLILMGTDPDTMRQCVGALKDERPLIYRAHGKNADDFIQIAAQFKVPLAVGTTTGDLTELAELTQRAKDKGVEDMILAFDSQPAGKTFENLTLSRRAALLKTFKPLGYPAMVAMDGYSAEMESLYSGLFAVKYASIVVMNDHQPWQLLPVFTAVQDIYTDPQVPNMVDAKLYEIGSVNEDSPVLFTTNFALTYFSVAGEVERSRIPSYICVVDTEGMGVLNAHAGDKISPEKVVKTLQELKATEKVKHRRLIIPGLLPFFRAELEDISEWQEVIIGPKTAREIPAFLNRVWN